MDKIRDQSHQIRQECRELLFDVAGCTGTLCQPYMELQEQVEEIDKQAQVISDMKEDSSEPEVLSATLCLKMLRGKVHKLREEEEKLAFDCLNCLVDDMKYIKSVLPTDSNFARTEVNEIIRILETGYKRVEKVIAEIGPSGETKSRWQGIVEVHELVKRALWKAMREDTISHLEEHLGVILIVNEDLAESV